MKPFFSVIIPTLNEEKFLPKLLNDLVKQKTKNFEVIIIDSQSKDQTKNEAAKFKNLNLLFKIRNKKNVSAQRNFGAKLAKGEYLLFLDADSRINLTFTGKLENIIKKKKGLFFVPSLKTDNSKTEPQQLVDIINFIFQISQNIGRPFALGAGIVIEKKYFFTLGGFDERLSFGEDYDLAIRSYNWGVRAKFLREIKFTYSLRRIRREGKLKAYYIFLISAIQYLLNGRTEKKFDYEMGGHLYKTDDKKKYSNILDQLNTKNIIRKIKKYFKLILREI